MFSNTSNLLKVWLHKSNLSLHMYKFKYLSLSATAVKQTEKLNMNETIQVANHLKPLINRPVNEILSNIDVDYTTPNEAVTFLKALRMHKQFNNVSPDNFISDSKFKFLCSTFQKHCNTLDTSLLISGLRSLLEVGMPVNSPCLVKAEKEVLANCHKFTTFNIIRCLHFHQKFVQSELQNQVVNQLKVELLKQISEVSTVAEVMFLCQILHLFSEVDQKKIELKVIELSSLLNIQELCKVIILLAQKSSRNITILNAVTFHIRQKQVLPNIKEIVDLLYAFKKLNYIDLKLFTYLLNTINSDILTITQPSLVSGLLTTCGHLRWKHADLLDACTDWMKSHFDKCRRREFIALILTSANLNYSTSKTKNLLVSIIPTLKSECINSPSIFLDIVWSLAILNYLPKQLLLEVLSSKFYESLLSHGDIQTQATNKLKLMNLKGVLKMKYPEYVFGCDLFLEPIKLKESVEIENSRKHVINVLSNFVPKEKYLCTNQCNDMGIFIDAEFIMDRNAKPLSLDEQCVINNETVRSKLLPKGAKRFALMVMFHKDYTLRTKTLTGVNALAIKLLTQAGYLVVLIPYDEFLRNQTEVQKAKFLMQKIKFLMQTTVEKN